MKIEINPSFSEAHKAIIVSRSEQIPTGRLVFEMSNKYTVVFPELYNAKYTVYDDVIHFNTGSITEKHVTKYMENTICEMFANGELKLGGSIDQVMQEFADIIEADKIETTRKLKERSEADKLHEYMAPQKKWEEYNTRKIRSRELAIKDAAQQAKEDMLEADKLAWVNEHGSPMLRKGIKRGYNCQKQYVIERSTSILGEEYIPDYDAEVDTKDRSCPSLKALEEVEGLTTGQLFGDHPGFEMVKVVWLPDGLGELNNPSVCDDTYDYQQCEAVEVRLNNLKGYWYRIF